MSLAIVTGASRGIGRDLARVLARRGHTVLAIARGRDELEALAAEDERIVAVPLDLADPEAVDATLPPLIASHGPVSVLVNNAGYGLRAAVEEIPMDRWRRQFEVNVFAAARVTQLVLPGMRARRGGRIVNISSVAGRISTPFSGAYGATKFALEAWSDSLRIEVAPWSIGVTLVEPGPVATDFLAAAARQSDAILDDPDSPYASAYGLLRAQLGDLHRGAWSAERVVDAIVGALDARRAPARVVCASPMLRVALWLRAVAPGVLDAALTRRFRAR